MRVNQERMEVDWESSAGGESLQAPRLATGAYVYRGHADVHWRSQPCDIVDSDWDENAEVAVVFACGCHAKVPREAITIGRAGGAGSLLLPRQHKHDNRRKGGSRHRLPRV